MKKPQASIAAALAGALAVGIVAILRTHHHSMKKAQPLMIMLLDGTPVGRTRQVWLCHCGNAVTFTGGKTWLTFRSGPEPEL